MKTILFPAAVLLLLPSGFSLAQAKPESHGKESNAQFIRDAESGAPARIADKAAIARLEPGGKVTRIREGSNGFTCTLIPDGSNAPMCGDASAFAWMVAAMSKRPRPPVSSKPGIVYMAQGGVHHETPDGEIVMEPSANTREVKEPPHWMLMYPFDSASGLPTRPNAGGTYIMFAGTPYAHLMVYQDPKKLKR